MSPNWPTVKLVNVPADAPSAVAIMSDEEFNWVSFDRSRLNVCGVTAPLPRAKLRGDVPPVAILPNALKVTAIGAGGTACGGTVLTTTLQPVSAPCTVVGVVGTPATIGGPHVVFHGEFTGVAVIVSWIGFPSES